jgi:hypothetical protein
MTLKFATVWLGLVVDQKNSRCLNIERRVLLLWHSFK